MTQNTKKEDKKARDIVAMLIMRERFEKRRLNKAYERLEKLTEADTDYRFAVESMHMISNEWAGLHCARVHAQEILNNDN